MEEQEAVQTNATMWDGAKGAAALYIPAAQPFVKPSESAHSLAKSIDSIESVASIEAVNVPEATKVRKAPRFSAAYTLPLEDGFMAQLVLALDLSAGETWRLQGFIAALVVPWRRETTAANALVGIDADEPMGVDCSQSPDASDQRFDGALDQANGNDWLHRFSFRGLHAALGYTPVAIG